MEQVNFKEQKDVEAINEIVNFTIKKLEIKMSILRVLVETWFIH
jgi:hypothetical protein